jgi:signal transduction histidine kinase
MPTSKAGLALRTLHEQREKCVSGQIGAAANGTPIRVVLADDTEDLRSLMRTLLEREGFEVVGEAGDGNEAIDVAVRTQPDLLLLDLAMPALDGLEALPRIRAAAPHTKVVVLSGFQAAQVGDEARDGGAHAYIEKGTGPVELIATLRQVLGGGRPTAPAPPPAPPPQEQVVSALIHELSAPVTVIEGFIDVIDVPESELDPEVYRRAVGAIRRNALHLRGLLTAFGDARRIDVNALDLRCEPTDVSALVTETAESLKGLIAPHPLVLDVAPTPLLDVDPVRVRQTVINLVQNAAKFSFAEEPIEISVRAGEDTVTVVVSDRGRGIADADRPRLFTKFTRLRRDTPGTGLGLYISRGIARAHGGDIVLEASSPAGSRFALTLPIGSEHDR